MKSLPSLKLRLSTVFSSARILPTGYGHSPSARQPRLQQPGLTAEDELLVLDSMALRLGDLLLDVPDLPTFDNFSILGLPPRHRA